MGKTMRPLLTLGLILMTAIGASARIYKAIETLDGASYTIFTEFGDPFKSDTFEWKPGFLFGKTGGISCGFVISESPFEEEGKKYDVVMNLDGPKVSFDARVEFGDINFRLSHFAITPIPNGFDKMSVEEKEAYAMELLATREIKTITIGDVVVTGSYPKPRDFRKIFDAGLAEMPETASWYNPHRIRLERIKKQAEASGELSKVWVDMMTMDMIIYESTRYYAGWECGMFGSYGIKWTLLFKLYDDGSGLSFYVAPSYDGMKYGGLTEDGLANKIEVEFSGTPSQTLLFDYIDDLYESQMRLGKIQDAAIDYDSKTDEEKEADVAYMLATRQIRSIRVNGFLLPGPYPTPSDFIHMFTALGTVVPDAKWYKQYCAKFPDATGKSRGDIVLFETDSDIIQGKDLSITDLITFPLGVMPYKGTLWNTDCEEIIDFVKTRTNWEMSKPFGDFSIYGNRTFGENSKTGYNMTYNGEPFFDVSFACDFARKKDVISYEYSFYRNIKGKVAKFESYRKDKILAQPQWTKDEAIDFAKKIVGDLESVGIRMHRVKNLKGDVFTMEGIDRTARTHYKVRVFKCDDDHSAFLSVSLILSAEGTDAYRDYKE